MLTLVKPKFFIPVHGEYRQLIAHAETAKTVGVSHENIFITGDPNKLARVFNNILKNAIQKTSKLNHIISQQKVLIVIATKNIKQFIVIKHRRCRNFNKL